MGRNASSKLGPSKLSLRLGGSCHLQGIDQIFRIKTIFFLYCSSSSSTLSLSLLPEPKRLGSSRTFQYLPPTFYFPLLAAFPVLFLLKLYWIKLTMLGCVHGGGTIPQPWSNIGWYALNIHNQALITWSNNTIWGEHGMGNAASKGKSKVGGRY